MIDEPTFIGEIKVFIKSVYGKELIYPACSTAKLFTELTRTLTLKLCDLDTIKCLGFKVVQVDAYENALTEKANP